MMYVGVLLITIGSLLCTDQPIVSMPIRDTYHYTLSKGIPKEKNCLVLHVERFQKTVMSQMPMNMKISSTFAFTAIINTAIAQPLISNS